MRFRLFGRVYTFSRKLYLCIIIIVLALVAAVGLSILNQSNSRERTLLQTYTPDFTPFTTPTLKPVDISPSPREFIAVYISGEVACPGVYWVSPGTILQELVNLAGGVLEDANLRHINLAMRLEDGMHIHFPKEGDLSEDWLLSTGNPSSVTPIPAKVNLNTATVEDLMTLSGIGESTAKDILQYRQENGPFTVIEDLMNVPGIKQARFDKIKNQITV